MSRIELVLEVVYLPRTSQPIWGQVGRARSLEEPPEPVSQSSYGGYPTRLPQGMPGGKRGGQFYFRSVCDSCPSGFTGGYG